MCECIQHCKDVVRFNYNYLLFLVLINKILHNTKGTPQHTYWCFVGTTPPTHRWLSAGINASVCICLWKHSTYLSILCMPQSKVWWVMTENTVCRLFEIISGTRWVDTDCQHSECHLMSDLYFKICLVIKDAIYSREQCWDCLAMFFFFRKFQCLERLCLCFSHLQWSVWMSSQQARWCRNRHVPQQDPMQQMPVWLPLLKGRLHLSLEKLDDLHYGVICGTCSVFEYTTTTFI